LNATVASEPPRIDDDDGEGPASSEELERSELTEFPDDAETPPTLGRRDRDGDAPPEPPSSDAPPEPPVFSFSLLPRWKNDEPPPPPPPP
jgi:hypothetical protein